MTTVIIPKDSGVFGQAVVQNWNLTFQTVQRALIKEHFGAIIGKGGQTHRNIQAETGSRIIVPKNDGPIRITGTIHAINAAKMKIQSISMEQTMFQKRRELGIQRTELGSEASVNAGL